jgi:hypothetical protein
MAGTEDKTFCDEKTLSVMMGNLGIYQASPWEPKYNPSPPPNLQYPSVQPPSPESQDWTLLQGISSSSFMEPGGREHLL